MKKNLNNKGYMLVEIILASAIAMGVAYFITDLTIKLKNKNDDLLVKTVVYTEQAIIYNELAEYLYTEKPIDCYQIENKFTVSGKTFKSDSFEMIISDYATIGSLECDQNINDITLKIPLKVKQLPDEDFNVLLKYHSL